MREDKDEVKIVEKAGILLLSVRVQPGATSDQIVGSYNGALKIRLTAPAQRNRANRHLLEFSASTLNGPAKTLSLSRGRSSCNKTVEIRGFSREELTHLLSASFHKYGDVCGERDGVEFAKRRKRRPESVEEADRVQRSRCSTPDGLGAAVENLCVVRAITQTGS